MNSLRNISSIGDWVAGMILLFRSPKYSNKIFLTVEGHTDISFLNAHFSNDLIHYDSPCSGKPEVINAVDKLREHGNQLVYGLCDADFDELEGVSYNNIYFTDCHDIEMMLIEGGSFDKFLAEFIKYDILRDNNISDITRTLKNSIIDITYKIGILKWLNYKNDLLLMFRGMQYDKFISFNDFEASIDVDKYIEHIFSRSPRKSDECTVDFLKSKFDELLLLEADYKYICNGHDFTYIIMMAFRLEFSRDKNMSQERVESHLRMAYSTTTFRQTQVHRHLSTILQNHVENT